METASEARALQLFWTTPLVHSKPLSALCGNRPVYLKLDCFQASGSFKDRGMSHLILQSIQHNGIQRVVSSSGGNAGLAAASIAQRLSISCTVVVPTTTKAMVIDKLRGVYNATVQVMGENWNEADAFVREMVAADTTGQTAYLPPYDHEWLWTGHSTVVDEIYSQLATSVYLNKDNESSIGACASSSSSSSSSSATTIIVSVGGGGLLCGVLEGLSRRQEQLRITNGESVARATMPRVIAAETTGASCFGQAWDQGKVVTLSSIDSIATSLGALSVAPTILERALGFEEQSPGSIASAICTDVEAVDACVKFARDHRILVEPACGAALAVIYSDRLRQEMVLDPEQGGVSGPIVIVVCGGSGVNIDLIQQWQASC